MAISEFFFDPRLGPIRIALITCSDDAPLPSRLARLEHDVPTDRQSGSIVWRGVTVICAVGCPVL